ncbi:MAG TPA: hypothetical protein EYO73_00050 [Sulfurimonas sp.]|nr:hypothetical protein [Sulfurimonas sp.]
MKKIGLAVDYSNICKDYNTSYLDRDNLDPATKKCMKQVLTWTKAFIEELLEHFEYKLYKLSSDTSVKVDDLAAKRFLFYSLEKEITLESLIAHNEYKEYNSLGAWEAEDNDSILIQNEEDGGSIRFFFNENSGVGKWIEESLKDFSLDEVTFEAIR